jgi:plastocyanin
MNKASLVLLIILLQIGAAGAGIEVRNANTTWNATVSLPEDSPSITERIVVEYANIIYQLNLTSILSPDITDRILIDQANTVYNPYLTAKPAELNPIVSPRIVIRAANQLWNPELKLTGIAFVDIKDNFFANSTITIPMNTVVTWINFGSATHTVTADGGSFESGSLQQNQSFSYRFNKSGIFSYHCSIHPSMTGIVNVTSAENQILRADCGQDKSKCENAGAPVQFDGSASSGSIVSYTWNFGDGTNGTGVTLAHKYTTYRWNGTAYQPFTVNLTVMDNDGMTNSKSQKVVIWIAGDSNGDGKVNILDASVIGLKWSTTDPCADLNNDGKVNIIDASIIGLNWGKTA